MLTIRLTPGRVIAVGDIITEDVLNDLANPTIELEGTVSTASIADASITQAKLAPPILTADTPGWALMDDAYVIASKLATSQDWTGFTLTGAPSIVWTGTIDFSGATFIPPAGGALLQTVTTTTDAVSTLTQSTGVGTGDMATGSPFAKPVIPVDDTIPQSDEGAIITALSTAFTPTSATNYLEIDAFFPVIGTTADAHGVLALFQDSTADAIAVSSNTVAATWSRPFQLHHRMLAGTTSATTFKIRLGLTAGVITVNGIGASRVFGGIAKAYLRIREFSA